MTKPFVIGVVGVVIGIIGGMILMMGLHLTSTLIYPIPEGIDLMSTDPAEQEKAAAWFGTLPGGAWVLALGAHGLGCMGGAAVATVIAGRRSLLPPLIVGVFFTVCSVLNLMSIPHPTWFAFADLPIYLVLAYAAGRLLRRREREA